MKRKITLRFFLYFSLALVLFSFFVGGSFLLMYTKSATNIYISDLTRRTEVIANNLSTYFENNVTDEDPFKKDPSCEIMQANLGLGIFLDFIDDIALSNLWIIDTKTQKIHVEFGKYNISYSAIPTNVRELIDTAMDGNSAIHERWGDTFLEKNLIIASPIKLSDGTTFAVVVLHARSHTLYNDIAVATLTLAGSLIVSLLIAFIPSYLFSMKVVGPLKKMAITTNKMTSGNYQVETGIEQSDEVGQLASNIDILAKHLLEASKESNQLDRLRKNYISNISHELRTPITVIRSSLEALCDGVVTSEDLIDSYYHEMLNESIHLDRIINDLLELSRLQSPHYAIEKSNLNFISVVEDVVRTAKYIAGESGGTIVPRYDLSVFAYSGDYGRLRQMLLTVLDNAIKFSYPGSSIYVTTSFKDHDCIVTISNSGDGIKEKDLPHIFQEYYMLTAESNKMGTGLGLAIAKVIADRHGISIRASSIPDKETVFTFKLSQKRHLKKD